MLEVKQRGWVVERVGNGGIKGRLPHFGCLQTDMASEEGNENSPCRVITTGQREGQYMIMVKQPLLCPRIRERSCPFRNGTAPPLSGSRQSSAAAPYTPL